MGDIRALEIPKWGLSMEEGTVTKWLINVGDDFAEGDEIVEIETSKIANVLEAPFDGTLARIVAGPGETLPVGALIGLSAAGDVAADELDAFVGASGGAAAPAEKAEAKAEAEAIVEKTSTQDTPKAAQSSSAVPAALVSDDDDQDVFATYHARKYAQDLGINLTKVEGTGRRGRISRADVESAIIANGGTVAVPQAAAVGTGQYIADDMIRATPAARKLAKEKGIALSSVKSAHGRISKEDVANARGAGGSSAEVNLAGSEPVSESNLDGMRRTIAQRLQQSKQNAPHYRVSMDCEIDELLKLRKLINSSRTDAKVSVNDFIIKASAMALIAHPDCNVQFDGETVSYFDHADISVAVAMPSGLITPKVVAADTKGLVQISNEVRDLATRARTNRLTADEFQGGTFTISNLGMFGVKQFDAIINPPQCAILAVGEGAAVYKPVNGQPVAVTQMTLSLSSDHRIIDGAVAAAFLSEIKKFIENPSLMLA